jgi:hypothetical protein
MPQVFVKDPDAIIDYALDWLTEGYLDTAVSPAEIVTASSWRVDPDTSPGITIVTDNFSDTITRVKVSGGQVGHRYLLTNTIETSGGRTDERSITLRVQHR